MVAGAALVGALVIPALAVAAFVGAMRTTLSGLSAHQRLPDLSPWARRTRAPRCGMAYRRTVVRPSRVPVRPILERLRFPALAAVGSLLAHDGIFAAQYGLGPDRDLALAATTHGYWPAFMIVTLLTVAVAAGATVAAVLHLRRLVRGLPATPAAPGRPSYLREVARMWPRLLLVVATAFLLQENLEHLAAGRELPGLWALSAPGYPLAIPVLVVVTGLLAAVGGWLQWHRDTLVRRLRAARAAALRRRTTARVPHGRWALVAALLAHRWMLLRRDAGRAPPAVAAT